MESLGAEIRIDRFTAVQPLDVGGFGACFFKSVAHQLYCNADLHYHVCTAGINNMNSHPELYVT